MRCWNRSVEPQEAQKKQEVKIKGWAEFFLYSSVFISVCAAAITAETYLLIYFPINWHYVAFVFFSTLVLYNFPVFFEKNYSAGESERVRWIAENKKLLAGISGTALVAAVILIFFFPFKFILFFAPIAGVAFAYFFPQTHLRSITGLKAGIVAFVWTCVAAIYPQLILSDFNFSFGNREGTIILLNFIFLFPLSVIFNVRDIEADRKAGVKTFPLMYGVKNTIVICLLALLIFSALVVFSSFATPIKISFLLAAATAAILISAATENRSDHFYVFWIDGLLLLQALLVALTRIF